MELGKPLNDGFPGQRAVALLVAGSPAPVSRPECLKRLRHLIAARKIQALAQIIHAQGAVVGDLLIEKPREFVATR